MNGFHLWVFGYLGLLQDRSRYMTPPPQVREQSDHSDQPDHWPCTALGPWSPNLTHGPLRHHCIMEKEKERILNTDQQCMKACFCIRFFFYLFLILWLSCNYNLIPHNVILYLTFLRLWLFLNNLYYFTTWLGSYVIIIFFTLFFFIHTEMCLHLKQPPKCVFVW